MTSYAELDEFEASLGTDGPQSTGGGGSDNVAVHEVEYPQKRKNPPTAGEGNPKKQSKVQEKKPQENRAVYVTNIPRDATVEEIEDVFKKYGMIDQGVDGKPRIKMYTDDQGDFNGEALVVFFRKDSVNLAIQLQDDYEFRLGDRANGNVRVQEADMSFKRHKDGDDIAKKLVRKDRKAAERTRAEMNRKLAEWSDNEDEVKEAYAPKKNKWSKMAIIKKVFELHQLEDDEAAILEIKEDMREAAEKYGEVTKVVLYDKEPEGIVSVRFKDFDAAEAFQASFNGRRYNGNSLEITIADDRPRFKKSAKGTASDSEDDAQRLEKFINNQDDDSD